MSAREQVGGPVGWRRTTLGEALPIRYGKARSDDHGTVREDTPVYGSSGVIDTFKRALTNGPTLIIGRKGTVGATHYSPEPCWPIDTVFFVEAPADKDLRFFKYLLDHLQLGKLDRSTAVPGLSRDDYNATEVFIPEFNEQYRIVAEIEKQFSRLEEGIANLEHVKANLKRYKAAVLKAAVEGRLAPLEAGLAHIAGTGFNSSAVELEAVRVANSPRKVRRGVPYEVPLSRVAESLTVPEGWSLNSVAELLQIGALRDVKDGNHGANHPRSEEFTERGLPFITATEVNNFRIDYARAAKVSGEPLAKLKVGFAEPGDVILTHKGTVGRVAINDHPCVLSPQTTYYRHSDTAFDRRYLQYFFASPQFYSQLADVKSQTTRDYVPISDQYRLFVLRPPLPEQSRIVAEVERRLSVIEELDAAVEANLRRAERLRQSILHQAFAGNLFSSPTGSVSLKTNKNEFTKRSYLRSHLE